MSGLGLEAQQAAVVAYLAGHQGELVAQFSEIETGKGANALAKRPQLRAALNLCRKQGATLIIAKLDRLARNVHFVSGLLESGCDFVAADMLAGFYSRHFLAMQLKNRVVLISLSPLVGNTFRNVFLQFVAH